MVLDSLSKKKCENIIEQIKDSWEHYLKHEQSVILRFQNKKKLNSQ